MEDYKGMVRMTLEMLCTLRRNTESNLGRKEFDKAIENVKNAHIDNTGDTSNPFIGY